MHSQPYLLFRWQELTMIVLHLLLQFGAQMRLSVPLGHPRQESDPGYSLRCMTHHSCSHNHLLICTCWYSPTSLPRPYPLACHLNSFTVAVQHQSKSLTFTCQPPTCNILDRISLLTFVRTNCPAGLSQTEGRVTDQCYILDCPVLTQLHMRE